MKIMIEKGSLQAKIRSAKMQLGRKNLTVATRQHLEEKIRENEALLKAAGEKTYKSEERVDTAQVKRNIEKDKATLEAAMPEKFSSGAEKDKQYSRAKELAEKIKEGMPTSNEMRTCPPGMINRHLKLDRENRERIDEWKNIMRRLDPSDPNVANVENLRQR